MKLISRLRKPAAFTLIELVVVIAIIAILAAMLLPALNNAKNRAQQSIDLNNNKQLLTATHMYVTDNLDYMPLPGWGTGDTCWGHAGGIPVGGGNVNNFSQVLSNQQYYCKFGQLAPYDSKEVKIFLCPADRVDSFYYQRNIYFSSYVWNGALNGYGASGQKSYKMTAFKPMNIIQWEADEKTPFYFNDISSYPDEGISGRHGKGATVGTASGATRRIPLNQYYGYLYAGPQGQRGATIPLSMLPNDMWCNPGMSNGRF